MIYGDPSTIMVQLELVTDYGTIKSGIFNLIVDGNIIPDTTELFDFYDTVGILQRHLNKGLRKNMPDVGAIPLEQLDFSEETPQNIIDLGATHLFDLGYYFWLGFDGDEDRFFYSMDYQNTVHEVRYPRGTVENLINALPTADEMEFCSKDAININEYLEYEPNYKHKETMPLLKGSRQGYLDINGNEWLIPVNKNESNESVLYHVMLSTKWCKSHGWPRKDLEIEKFKLLSEKASPTPVSLHEHIDFYHEVKIVAGENSDEDYKEYIGRKGVVLGISESKGVVHGYGVYFRDDKLDEFLTFDADEVIPTGLCFRHEEFYDGSYAHVIEDDMAKIYVSR